MQRAEDPANNAGLQHPQMAQGPIGVLFSLHFTRGTRTTERNESLVLVLLFSSYRFALFCSFADIVGSKNLDSVGFPWEGSGFRSRIRFLGCFSERNGTTRISRKIL